MEGKIKTHYTLQQQTVKKARGLISKTTTSHVQHNFCTFLCRRCTNTTGKCLISRLMEDVNKPGGNFLSFTKTEYSSRNSTPGEIA